jgi:hypothetical protein
MMLFGAVLDSYCVTRHAPALIAPQRAPPTLDPDLLAAALRECAETPAAAASCLPHQRSAPTLISAAP